MKISDEALEAATRAIHDMDCDAEVCTGETLTTEGRYGRWARAAVEAAAPLIAAQVLRDAADLVDRGPTFPLPPSIISALLRERADDATAAP
jgi:hypothetical protein